MPKFTSLNSAFPDYARYVDVCREVEAKYAYNPDKAKEIIAEVMAEMGATLGADGKWQFNGAPVTLIGIIRTEDERKDTATISPANWRTPALGRPPVQDADEASL